MAWTSGPAGEEVEHVPTLSDHGKGAKSAPRAGHPGRRVLYIEAAARARCLHVSLERALGVSRPAKFRAHPATAPIGKLATGRTSNGTEVMDLVEQVVAIGSASVLITARPARQGILARTPSQALAAHRPSIYCD